MIESWSLIILPFAIFFARIIDVSIGTLRIIFLTRGLKYLAGLLGFFESLVWILAISQVMQNLNDWVAYLAYACGFAAGNIVGIWFEERIAMGNLIVRVITRLEADELVIKLRDNGFSATAIDAEGEEGPVKAIFVIIKRKMLTEVLALIRQYNPKAFYTIEDVRFVSMPHLAPLAAPKRTLQVRRALRMRK
ncbi:DUF2179 domain-containing protein [Geopsychrobacter electrodiphilus]|uniref:DUF2179 domain-containing protein n=1 Tax=Geopsychrobacter electrodiphilus TaxID=225196 RepID=UPI00036CB410|nr:DUF2179 domain-containing protein [Geopsychrobacter electrodiphilus]